MPGKQVKGKGSCRRGVQEEIEKFFYKLFEGTDIRKAVPRHEQALLVRADVPSGHHIAVVVLPEATKTPLSGKEHDIARLVGHGLGNGGIAKRLKMGKGTVCTHLKSIFKKWEVKTRAELARYAAILLG